MNITFIKYNSNASVQTSYIVLTFIVVRCAHYELVCVVFAIRSKNHLLSKDAWFKKYIIIKKLMHNFFLLNTNINRSTYILCSSKWCVLQLKALNFIVSQKNIIRCRVAFNILWGVNIVCAGNGIAMIFIYLLSKDVGPNKTQVYSFPIHLFRSAYSILQNGLPDPLNIMMKWWIC